MLTILIPTYNRSVFLLKNLIILDEIAELCDLKKKLKIIVSDNASPDDTTNVVKGFMKNHSLDIEYIRQERNIGLQANMLDILDKSDDEFIMYLGDDDYLNANYLKECFKLIETDKELTAIIPNFVPVSVDGDIIGPGREDEKQIIKFLPGFNSILMNSWKAHQMSGLVFKREGLHSSYLQKGVDNLYPFIYFAGLSCMKGNCYLVSQFPVKVTQPIAKKDWSYKEDGLVNDVFDNYRKLPGLSYLQKSELELYFLQKQEWRIFLNNHLGRFFTFKSLCKVLFAPNSTILFSFAYPFKFLKGAIMRRLKK